MHDDRSWIAANQPWHVRMERRVPDVIEHSVELREILDKPIH